MKVWSYVFIYEGILVDMKVFPTMEIAKKFFHDRVNALGSVEDCDPNFYNDGNNECFYWDDGNNNTEIHIWPIYMEMED